MRTFALSFLLVATAHATTIPVTSPTDEVETNGLCSLREAVQAASTDTSVDSCPAGQGGGILDLLFVDASINSLTLELGEITLRDVVLYGEGLTIDADASGRIFVVRPGDAEVWLDGLHLTDGWATSGGAIRVEAGARLTLENVSLTDSRALETGGCIAVDGGTLIVTNAHFSNCRASQNGGALALDGATTTLLNATGSTNATGGNGGFAYVVAGSFSEENSEVEFCEAGFAGGALYLGDTEATLRSSRYEHNDAREGGAIEIVRSTATMTFGIVTFNDAERGGAIAALAGTTLTLDRTEIDENVADLGAGLFLDDAIAVVIETAFFLNEANDFGGGIYARGGSLTVEAATLRDNGARLGGGLYAHTDATVRRSLFYENAAQTDLGVPPGEMRGGGIYVNGGTLSLVTSTLSANEARTAFDGGTDSDGGAIHVQGGTVRVESATVVGNSAVRDGGGISREGGTLEIKNSIVAGNSAARAGADCTGEITSMDHNLIESTDGCTITGTTDASVFGVAPGLGPLADNGGPTASYLPEEGSPVVDAGMTDLVFDQRGYARDATPDIGAVERGAFPPLASEPEPEAVRSVTVAPNPARASSSVAFQAEGHATLSLYDVRGRLVTTLFDGHTTGTRTVEADLRGLAPGVYLLRLSHEEGAVSRPLVVAR